MDNKEKLTTVKLFDTYCGTIKIEMIKYGSTPAKVDKDKGNIYFA